MVGVEDILQPQSSDLASTEKYSPAVGDIVLGVITIKTADNFKVDIGTSSPAILSNIAFNSATKRHRPNLKVGQLIICHVTAADEHFDFEVSCHDPTTQKDWVTSEVYFGALPEGGLVVEIPVAVSKSLMARKCPIFPILGRHLKPFELALGVNGRVYIKTAEGEYLRAVLLRKALLSSSSISLEDLEKMCQEMEHRLSHSV